MLRKIIYFVLVISLACNIYCGFDYYMQFHNKEVINTFITNWNMKNISMKDGHRFLFDKIKGSNSSKLKNKKYYFVSIWNTLCKPCIKEMPLLDSLADNITRKDIGYIFLTENSDKIINKFKESHHVCSKNFIFINDADTYISAILKSQHLKNRVYPIQLIIDNKGSVLYSTIGTIDSANDSTIISYSKRLPF